MAVQVYCLVFLHDFFFILTSLGFLFSLSPISSLTLDLLKSDTLVQVGLDWQELARLV